jgi:hypothetical protein
MEKIMEQIQQRSEPMWIPLMPRLICEKCVHKASVIVDRHPLCGDCFMVESTKAAAAPPPHA